MPGGQVRNRLIHVQPWLRLPVKHGRHDLLSDIALMRRSRAAMVEEPQQDSVSTFASLITNSVGVQEEPRVHPTKERAAMR
jgi:hypothetical protein